jgi:hypothetical protein
MSSDMNDLATSLNTSDMTLAYLMLAQYGGAGVSTTYPEEGYLPYGFFGNAFRVVPSSGMDVQIVGGYGLARTNLYGPGYASNISSIQGLNNYQVLSPIYCGGLTLTVPAAPSSPNNRIDIIEVKASYQLTGAETRDVFDVATETFVPTSVNKLFSWRLSSTDVSTVSAPSSSTGAIGYKIGVAASSPTVPSTTSGYIKVAEIHIANGVTTITSIMISDHRRLLAPGGQLVANALCQISPSTPSASSGSSKTGTPGLRHFTFWDSTNDTICWVMFPGKQVDAATAFARAEYLRSASSADAHFYLMQQLNSASGTIVNGDPMQVAAGLAGIEVGPNTKWYKFVFNMRHQNKGTTDRTPDTDPYSIKLFATFKQEI